MAPAIIVLLGFAGLAKQAPPSQPATSPPANAPQVSPADGPVFRAGVSLVKVDVQVVDHSGHVITGLTKDDFRVYDEGQPQKIVYFGTEKELLDLVLLLDVSGSMSRHLEQLAATALASLKQLFAGDRVAVMLFARRSTVREPLTENFRAVEEELRDAVRTNAVGSGTAINSGIIDAAQYLQQQRPRGRRAVLIVTDNLSLNYRVPDEEVIRQLYAADAVLNGIVIGKQKHPAPPRAGQYVNPDFTFADVFKLAGESGGEAMEGSKIAEAFANMIERIRARYSLQYDAPLTNPGALHRIQVQLAPETRAHHTNAVIRARAGYYAAK